MKIITAALCLLVITGEGVFAKKKAKHSDDKISKCLKLKGEKAKTDCLVAAVSPVPGEWTFSEVTKSPINDAATVSAQLVGDSVLHRMTIGCYEGVLYLHFSGKIFLSTLRDSYPIIYRVDSEPAVDCSGYDLQSKCYPWAVSADNSAAGIWHNADEFIDEIKAGKKLTVRLTNHSGDERTMVFPIEKVAETYAKIKGICAMPEAPATEGEK